MGRMRSLLGLLKVLPGAVQQEPELSHIKQLILISDSLNEQQLSPVGSAGGGADRWGPRLLCLNLPGLERLRRRVFSARSQQPPHGLAAALYSASLELIWWLFL